MRLTSTQRERGLTLIELLVGTSIVAVLAAIAIPNLLDQRVGMNESSAQSDLRDIGVAQASYHAFVGVYAGNFQTLIDTGFLSATFFPTTLGTKSGYIMTLCAAPPCDPPGAMPPLGTDGSSFRSLAVPASVAAAHRVFTIDDSGLLLAAIGTIPTPADEVIDLPTGPTSACQTSCVTATPPPMPSQLDIDTYAATVEALATSQAIPDIDGLTPEDAISLAIGLFPTSTEWSVVLSELDGDSSGSLDWNEILTSNLLTVARDVKATIPGSDPGPSVGPDVAMTNITSNYQTDLSTLLALGTADEDPTPPLMITATTGDPVALLMPLLAAVPAFGWLGSSLLTFALLATAWKRARRSTSASS